MTPEEEKRIARWGHDLANAVEIELILNKDERSEEFKHFVDRLTDMCSKIRVHIEQDDEP